MAWFVRFVSLVCAVFAISSAAHAATVTVNLVNRTTAAPVVVPAGKTVTVGCSNGLSGGSAWSGNIIVSAGTSSGSNSTVPNGATILCELPADSHSWMPNELGLYDRAGPYTVTVPSSGGAVSFAAQLRPTDGTMTIDLLNADTGAPVTVPGSSDEKVFCSSSRYSFQAPFSTNSTSVTLSVFKSEVYTCSVDNLSGYYTGNSFTVVVPSTGSATRSVTLKPINQSITLLLKDAAGNPFTPTADETGWFSCFSSSRTEYYQFNASTTFNGSASSVTIQVADNRTYTCSGDEIGQNKPFPVTVTVPAGQSASVAMTVLEPTVTTSFSFELNGAPLAMPAGGANLRCFHSGSEVSLEPGKNISAGATSTTIGLFPGYEYECQLTNIDGYYQQQSVVVNAAVGSSPSHVINLEQMQATIQVNLVNLAGTAFLAPQQWNISCYEHLGSGSSYTQLFYSSIAAGQSSAQRLVPGGKDVSCSLSSQPPGYAVRGMRKTIPVSGTTVFDLMVYPTDASVTVRLVDINGVLLTDLINCSVTAIPADGDFSYNLEATAVGGQATIAVPSGVPITTTADCESDGVTGGAVSSDGSIYLQPLADLSRAVTIASGATATADQVFSLPDATMQIILEDQNGARLPGVQMYVASEATSTGGVYYAGGDTNGDGVLSVPVVSQLRWHVHAYAAHDGNANYTHMGSNEVTVSPAVGQVTDVLLRVKPVTHQLTINITTSDVPSGNGYCMAYDRDGVFEYTPERPPLSEVRQIPLSTGSWKLVCIGWGTPTGATQEINLLSDIIDIETPVDTSQFAVTVQVKRASDRISAQSSFLQGQGGSVEAPGVRFSVPADAVPISSASLRVSNAFSSASPSPDRDLGLPFRTFRVDLLDRGNNSFGQFAASELTLFATAQPGQSLIVKELFGSLWRDVGSVRVASAARMTNDSVKGLNSGDASVTATVKRSGVYGVFVTGEAAGKNPVSLGKVNGLRVKFAKGVAKMSWKVVSGATSYNVRVHQTIKAKKGMRQRLVRSRQVTTTKLDVKGLKRGQYTFTVWAVSASAQGEASSAKARN